MRVQRFAHAPDRMNRSASEVAAFEERLRFRDDRLPERIADALVQRAVADHGEAACLRCDEDQGRVGRIVSMQTRAAELVDRTIERIDGFVWNDAHRDATGGAVLRACDRLSDSRAVAARHGLKFTAGGFSAPGWAAK